MAEHILMGSDNLVKIIKKAEDQFSMTLGLSDTRLFNNVINEVAHGFALPNFEATIGMTRGAALELLTKFQKTAAVLEAKAGTEETTVTLNVAELIALKNALLETLKELGEEEFSIRTGDDFADAEGRLRSLTKAISGEGLS
jgi:hypothetical protein